MSARSWPVREAVARMLELAIEIYAGRAQLHKCGLDSDQLVGQIHLRLPPDRTAGPGAMPLVTTTEPAPVRIAERAGHADVRD